jgi:ABC-2 type transport system permease protein
MKHISVASTLRRFSFRQTVRGAVILGIFGGLIMGAQGIAYATAYPTEQSRAGLVALLSATPAFNFMSGEIKNAAEPASYGVYKSLPLMVIITGLWGLMTTTRLLRGNEEDGRLELLESGSSTKRKVQAQLLTGFGYSLLLAAILTFLVIAAFGADPKVGLSLGSSAYLTFAVYLPGVFFAGLGVLTSQIALTRARAVVYGLVPLIVFFVIRGVGNVATDFDWLKKLSPFGWSDLLNPVLGPQALWVAPSLVFGALFVGVGLWMAGRRDYGESLISQSDKARSHFWLLGSPLTLAIRQNIGTFIWWAIGIVFFTSFMAAVAGKVADILNDSPAAKNILSKISSGDIKLAFLGVDTVILALALLAMTIVGMAALRRDEAKGYLDNFLVRPIRRDSWLVGRLALIIGMTLAISLIATTVAWSIARNQAIDISLFTMIQGAVSLMGIVALMLGLGTFIYGLWPRVAVPVMVALVAWAYIIDILKGLFHLADWTKKTSLLSYIPANPSKTTDWPQIVWLLIIGIVLTGIGLAFFRKRDIIQE